MSIYLGTTKGAYRSTNRGDQLGAAAPARCARPTSGRSAIHPKNPRIVYAGVVAARRLSQRRWRRHWHKMADPGLPDRVIMAFPCRVMRLDVDPNSPDDVYATLEANGAMRSRNARRELGGLHRRSDPLLRGAEIPEPDRQPDRDRGHARRPRARLSAPRRPAPCSWPTAWASSAATTAASTGRTWRSAASRR